MRLRKAYGSLEAKEPQASAWVIPMRFEVVAGYTFTHANATGEVLAVLDLQDERMWYWQDNPSITYILPHRIKVAFGGEA